MGHRFREVIMATTPIMNNLRAGDRRQSASDFRRSDKLINVEFASHTSTLLRLGGRLDANVCSIDRQASYTRAHTAARSQRTRSTTFVAKRKQRTRRSSPRRSWVLVTAQQLWLLRGLEENPWMSNPDIPPQCAG